MKKNLLFVFTMMCALSFFTACSDDDGKTDEPDVPVLLKGETAYSGEKLQLNYGDAAMQGKEVTFTTTDGKTASLTMKGLLDLSSLLPSKSSEVISLAPGVIPGEASTVISNIVLTQDGEKYTFEGKDSNDSREIAYSGEADSTSLKLSLTVKFPTNELVGTWNLTKYDNEEYTQEPVYYVWEADSVFSLFGGSMKLPAGSVLAMGLRMPMGAFCAEEMLNAVLKDVTFKEDGNIVASYSEGKNMQSPQWVSSPMNMAQYTVNGNTVRVFLNIDMVLANLKTKAGIADLPAGVLEGIMANIVPMLSQGIPLKYNLEDGKLAVYADTELLKTLMGTFLPLLQDENMMNMIMESVKNNPDFATFAPMLEGMLQQLPVVLDSTTKIELGLNLEK